MPQCSFCPHTGTGYSLLVHLRHEHPSAELSAVETAALNAVRCKRCRLYFTKRGIQYHLSGTSCAGRHTELPEPPRVPPTTDTSSIATPPRITANDRAGKEPGPHSPEVLPSSPLQPFYTPPPRQIAPEQAMDHKHVDVETTGTLQLPPPQQPGSNRSLRPQRASPNLK